MSAIRGVTAHALATPSKLALVAGDDSLTYAELADSASILARILVEKGAGPGRPVASVLQNGTGPFLVATAAAMAGAPYLPVNFHLKAAELEFLLQDADVGAIVCEPETAGEVIAASSRPEAVFVLDGPPAGEPIVDAESGPGPELVFYTSGTTARPKGVVHGGLGNVEARAAGLEGQVQLWGWSADDVYILAGPAYHASHAGWGLTALFVGATTVMLDRFDAREYLEAVERHRGTRSFMVPAHFIRLLELDASVRGAIDSSSLQLIVHGAAPCPIAVKRKMMETFPGVEIYELYGASEGGATRISPEEWLAHPGSVGKPWPGVEIRILDEYGVPVPPGAEGIIWIKPPGTQRFTYRNNPDATSEAWRGDAFSVGDIGHIDDDGYLTITDRVSDMVLWGGVNIAPREVEEALFGHPAVVDCAVFGIPDERNGERLKAIVECRTEVTEDELVAWLRERLADFKVPRDWEFVDELPRDPNGKVLKRLLKLRS